MRRGHAGVCRMLGEQPVKKGIARTARRFFNAAVRLLCQRGNVRRLVKEGDAVRAAEGFAEVRVARRFLAAQTVVEVRRGERVGKAAA